MVRRGALATAGATLALALTACAAFTGGSDSTPATGQVSTDISGVESATLTLAYTDDPPTEELVNAFTALNPNVEIELEFTPFADYIKTINLQMAEAGSAPDIAQYNPGAMRSLVPGGHLLALDPYADAYGWQGRFPSASLDPMMLDQAASRYATGSLYATPGALSVLGVFYNPALLEEAGVDEPPTTMGHFEDALEAVHEAGIQPFSVGGLETGGIHLWCSVLNVTVDVDRYRDWIYGAPGSTIETDAALAATERIDRWVEAGYVPEGASAVSDEDARTAFINGESAFLVTGNWATLTLELEMEDSVGFFLMPGEDDTDPPVASGSSVAYAISSYSEHPDVAAAFLDFLASPQAAAIQVDSGFMPVDTHAPTEAYGLLNEVNQGFGTVADSNGIVPFPDFATPGMIDPIISGLQGLFTQTSTSAAYLSSLQTEWDRHHHE